MEAPGLERMIKMKLLPRKRNTDGVHIFWDYVYAVQGITSNNSPMSCSRKKRHKDKRGDGGEDNGEKNCLDRDLQTPSNVDSSRKEQVYVCIYGHSSEKKNHILLSGES